VHDAIALLDEPPLAALRALCPRCRRLVEPDRPCAIDASPTWRPSVPAERAHLVEALWGDEDRRKALRATTAPTTRRLRTGVAIAAGTYGAAFAFAGATFDAVVMALAGGVAGAALSGVRSMRRIPADAAVLPRWPRVGSGRIVAAAPSVSPGSLMQCAAFAVELRYTGSWGTRATLRIGASAGLEIELDGGAHLRVAPGPLWSTSAMVQLDGEDAVIDDLVAWLDPEDASAEWKLFPYNEIHEATLEIGDRVEVFGEVEPRPAAADPTGLYRVAAPGELVHTGLPIVAARAR
jgi:hypothetical protein